MADRKMPTSRDLDRDARARDELDQALESIGLTKRETPRPFNPEAPVRAGFPGFLDDAALVHEWAETVGEDFQDAAHSLRLSELQHGIHVAEGLARDHHRYAEAALEVAEALRNVARNVSRVGQEVTAEPLRTTSSTGY